MTNIISEIQKIIHQTSDLIDFEERVRLLMYDTFACMVGDVLTSMNRVIVKQKQVEGWTVERNDEREIQFTFGVVRFTHTPMYDLPYMALIHPPLENWQRVSGKIRTEPLISCGNIRRLQRGGKA